MSALQRITRITAAYDCIRNQPCVHGSEKCQPGTGGNHGIHSCELHMTVRGAQVEITLVVITGWHLPTVPLQARRRTVGTYPNGAYVEFHTAMPMHAGQEPTIRTELAPDAACQAWDNCYFDRGYLLADEPTALLVAKGSEAAWEWLERTHDRALCDMLDLVNTPREKEK